MSAVCGLYSDASKAFDRVYHSKLFNVLQAQGKCPLILSALFNMYTHSVMKVRQRSEVSNSFTLQNGVKQGGCLSPMLFTVYFDGLIEGWKGVLLVGDIVVYLVGTGISHNSWS